jgi:hypothetical protein
MTDNGTQMFIAAGANGYIYNNTDITLTCNTTNTSTTVTTAFTGAIWVGQPVSGSGIPASTTVASITNDTTFELSQAATATASGVTLAFTPFLEQITDL